MYRGILMAGDIDVQELVAKLGKLPLQYEPGTQWHYSIANDIQGRLIEVLSGMRFGEFLQQRLFAPLDMQDTAFYVPVDKLSRLTQLYKPRGGIGFGLGVGIVLDSGRAQEISSPGTYSWGGAAGTRFWVDPKENLIGIFMVQSVPHMTSLGDDFRVLSYAAMTESQIAD